jgi:hypothetical protein
MGFINGDTFGEKLGAIFQNEYLISNRLISLENRAKFIPLLKYKKKNDDARKTTNITCRHSRTY